MSDHPTLALLIHSFKPPPVTTLGPSTTSANHISGPLDTLRYTPLKLLDNLCTLSPRPPWYPWSCYLSHCSGHVDILGLSFFTSIWPHWHNQVIATHHLQCGGAGRDWSGESWSWGLEHESSQRAEESTCRVAEQLVISHPIHSGGSNGAPLRLLGNIYIPSPGPPWYPQPCYLSHCLGHRNTLRLSHCHPLCHPWYTWPLWNPQEIAIYLTLGPFQHAQIMFINLALSTCSEIHCDPFFGPVYIFKPSSSTPLWPANPSDKYVTSSHPLCPALLTLSDKSSPPSSGLVNLHWSSFYPMGPVDTLGRVFMAQFWPSDALGQAYPVNILRLLAMAYHQALFTSSGPLITLIIGPPCLPHQQILTFLYITFRHFDICLK